MAFQQSDLDQLRAALSTGIRSVTFADGRRTEYQNAGDLVAAIDMVEKSIAGEARAGRPRRRMTILQVGRRR
ncbi:phage head-tail joining protein [Sphingomonas sp. AX6]|uniref:phage head-tail joining protein n=1 Tax=Sphingomonas sp. AX6 TaxID=2653171 RepID=UPI0012EF2ECD|nr:hypothetical protein SPHINGOAX6_30205 [Sphingomonas sp. AX6]